MDDWFQLALDPSLSLPDALAAVRSRLEARMSTLSDVAGLLLAPQPSPARTVSDSAERISSLARDITQMRRTLEARLPKLEPQRPGPWFRENIVTEIGPFKSALFADPVFGWYRPSEVDKVQRDLQRLWDNFLVEPLPFKDHESTLWRRILLLRQDLCHLRPLAAIARALPESVRSAALEEFLSRENTRLGQMWDELHDCATLLQAASSRLWTAQRTGNTRERLRQSATAAQVREELRQRRQKTASAAASSGGGEHEEVVPPSSAAPSHALVIMSLSPRDLAALRILGFSHIPTQDELRERYLAMARQVHPDVTAGDDRRFKELASAYRNLLGKLRFSKDAVASG